MLGGINTFTGATSIGFGTTVLVSGRSGSGGTSIGTDATEEVGARATADAGGMTSAAGALLQLDNLAVAGAGTLAFTAGDLARIAIGATVVSGLPRDTIAGFALGDTIALTNIGLSATFGTISATDMLKLVTNRGTASLQLTGVSTQAAIGVTADGTGIDITFAPSGVTNFTVAGAADLNHALAPIDVGGTDAAVNTVYTLTFTGKAGGTIGPGSTELDAIDLAGGSSLLIAGNGMVLDGGGTERGLLDYSGAITVDNMTIQHMTATGGGGVSGGGGGLGGGLFVAAGLILRKIYAAHPLSSSARSWTPAVLTVESNFLMRTNASPWILFI